MNRIIGALALAIAITLPALGEEKGHHGDETPLATKQMGQWKVTANRLGEWKPGKEGAATVDLVPATPAAKAVRVWIGAADGKGAQKAKGEPEKAHPGGWHCHVAVPDPVPADAQFWVSIETEAGEQLKESFPLQPAAAK